MKIGVLFRSRFDDPGEFLADARAMEAAGVDSVWMEDDGVGLDPWLALAAIAAVTTELRLGVITSSNATDHRRIETLQQLSRQRLITIESPTTSPSPLAGEGRGGGWRRVEVPLDREAWAATLEQAGDVEGVIVPMDARLLDILRNPEGAIDRSDLVLAQG